MSEQLPCEIPCPKCGSGDVGRKYYPKDHNFGYRATVPAAHKVYTDHTGYVRAIREFIGCVCRVCLHAFEVKPLRKIKKLQHDAAWAADAGERT